MSFPDSAYRSSEGVEPPPRLLPADARARLLPLPVAAVIAYGRLIGDATDVPSTSALQNRLDRLALALSAVAKVYTEEAGGLGFQLADDRSPTESLFVYRDELVEAIDTLRKAGVAFTG